MVLNPHLKKWIDCKLSLDSQEAQWERPRLPIQEMQGTQVQSLGQEVTLEEETATHSSILA